MHWLSADLHIKVDKLEVLHFRLHLICKKWHKLRQQNRVQNSAWLLLPGPLEAACAPPLVPPLGLLIDALPDLQDQELLN